jgi:DNA-binding transcriptional ArsR family regulator
VKRAPRERHVHAARPTKAPRDEVFVRAAALFRAAGDVARLRLLHRLSRGESCVSELAADASTKMSTLSQQLRLLYAERIVERRRDGKHIYYRLADDHVKHLVSMVLEHAAH